MSFFEVEPQRSDISVPWIYDASIYLLEDGELSLSFSIHPAYRDVKVVLKHCGHRLYEFEARGVKDVRVFREKGGEILEITLSEQQNLWIKLHPLIEIVQKNSPETVS